jgi:hypothetical protein
MPEYRAYFIGSDGHFIDAKHIPCDNDETATAAAEQLVNGHEIELWHGNRKVAAFNAKPE